MVPDRILLGDIGGTTARFAVLTGSELGPIAHVLVRDCASVTDAIAGFLRNDPDRTPLSGGVLGAAGPVEEDRCEVTNSHWTIDARELRAAFGFKWLRLINDFEALAWSLPHLSSDDVKAIGDGEASPGKPMIVIGPGTGLGIAALIPRETDMVVVASEGGHASLPSASKREDGVVEQLRQRFGHVSAERALSGAGLENLHWAIATQKHTAVRQRTAAEITKHALEGTCMTCRAATDMFCAMLGGLAGDLALIFRARGGVYIGGGIAPRLAGYLARSEFRERFVAKGRLRGYLEAMPTRVITHEDAAFLGLRSLASCRGAR